jgi:hypothetical protein
MRALAIAFLGVVVAGCSSGGSNCRAVGDAGSQARTLGEPCGDHVVGCATGLSCVNVRLDVLQEQCVLDCDGGGCGNGAACLSGHCVPTCSASADCPGRFGAECRPTDAGVGLCIAVGCNSGTSCPSGTCVDTTTYCCPPGAPCVAPPPGVCLK